MDHCTLAPCEAPGQLTSYTLADDQPTELEPAFTFHGFRYAEVESEAEILTAEFVAISSDTDRDVGTFECSDQEPQPISRERRLVTARQFRVGAYGLPPAGRAPRVDRGRSSLRQDCERAVRLPGVLVGMAQGSGARPARHSRRAVRRARRGPRRRGAVRPGRDGATPPRSCPGRCTRPTEIRRFCSISSTA